MKTLSKNKILLVDDTKINIDILVQTLKDQYKLGVALNGKKALQYLKSNSVDLILLDILMPEMDGFEVCFKLKEDPATQNIPVIFITAVEDIEHKTKGFELGAVDYITKPFDITEVKARIKTHLMLKNALEALESQNIILDEKVKIRTKELEDAQIEIIERLSIAAEFRDEETGNHVKRMSKYCKLLASACGLSEEKSDMIALASTMHDLGKIGVPDNILLKPGKLDNDEWKIMRIHPTTGSKMLAGSNSKIIVMAETIALTHHEKWDGSGYPNGLSGKDIPIEGRIACICDVFDALTSTRPYKEAWPAKKAFKEIKACSNTFFDPELADLFLTLTPEIKTIMKQLPD